MIPGIWTKWTHELPPLDVEIEGKWDRNIMGEKVEPHLSTGRRCKRGCCFVDNACGENLVPPQWWRVPAATSLGEEL